MTQLPPDALARWLADPASARPVLLDVREPWEVEIACLEGSLQIPMQQVPGRLDDIPRDRPVVCVCHHGVRSLHVAHYLARQGFEDLFNLAGGIDAWAREIDPSCPTY